MQRSCSSRTAIYRTFVLFISAALGEATLALGGCAHTSTGSPPAELPVADYRLGRDDQVDVQVWKEPALSAAVTVRPDGRITLPMVGELQAEGRTALEVQREVAEKLRPLVTEPSVTVIVKEVKAQRFYVLGEVAHPGMYPLTGPLSVIEAMAVAGGPTEFARTGRMVVLRPGLRGASPARIVVSLDELVSGRRAPVVLLAGDTIYVP